MDADTAQSIGQVVSDMIGDLAAATAGDSESEQGSFDRDATAQLHAVLVRLAEAASTHNGTVVRTGNLNFTAHSRTINELSATPVLVPSIAGVAEVSLPQDALASLDRLDAAVPVTLLLYTSSHLMYPFNFAGNFGNITIRTISPLFSVSLLQDGLELEVNDLASPSNISVPLLAPLGEHRSLARSPSSASSSLRGSAETVTCSGTFTERGPTACRPIECRGWRANDSQWSADGCTTIAAPGLEQVICSCDSLTAFAVFEFPMSGQQLIEDINAALVINRFTLNGLQCFAKGGVLEVWTFLAIVLAIFLALLAVAMQRDDAEIHLVEALVAGRLCDKRPSRFTDKLRFEGRWRCSSTCSKSKSVDVTKAPSDVALRAAPQGEAAAKRSNARASSPSSGLTVDTRAPNAPAKLGRLALRAARQNTSPRVVRHTVSSPPPSPPTGLFTLNMSPVSPPPQYSPCKTAARWSRHMPTSSPPSTSHEEAEFLLMPEASASPATAMQSSRPAPCLTRTFEMLRTPGGTMRRAYARPNRSARSCEPLLRSYEAAVVSARQNWKKARRIKSLIIFVRRWHRDVNGFHKRMFLAFRQSHTLLAGVAFRGATGFTRAQTVQVLLNSICLELTVLCMCYSDPSGSGPMVINPIKIAVSGSLAAFICVPGMLIFSWCFAPAAFVSTSRSVQHGLVSLICLPWACFRLCGHLLCETRIKQQRAGTTEQLQRWNACDGTSITQSSQGDRESSTAADAIALAELSLQAPRPLPCLTLPFSEVCDSPVELIIPADARHFSYASLNEHMVRLSLRRSVSARDWSSARAICFGWILNWIITLMLLGVIALYGCEFYESNLFSEQLLLSWAWSAFQRFIINEPVLILFNKNVPAMKKTLRRKLLAKAAVRIICKPVITLTEVLNNLLGLMAECLRSALAR